MRLTKKYTHGCVYAISSKETGVVYVGATRTSLAVRMGMHRAAARAGRTSPITRWMRENMGIESAMVLLDNVPVVDLDAVEQRFIEAFKASGAGLLNVQATYYDKSPD